MITIRNTQTRCVTACRDLSYNARSEKCEIREGFFNVTRCEIREGFFLMLQDVKFVKDFF